MTGNAEKDQPYLNVDAIDRTVTMMTASAQAAFTGKPAKTANTQSIIQALVTGAAFVVVYVLLAWMTRFYMVRPFSITPWNPVSGVALAFLLIYGIRYWPALAVASVSTSLLLRGIPVAPYTQLLAPVVLTGGYIAMAALLLGPLRLNIAVERLRDFINIAAIAATGTLLMAIAYVSVFRSVGTMSEQDFSYIMLRFWIGHLIGIVINTPLLLVLVQRRASLRQAVARAANWETVAQCASMVLALWVIFGPHWVDPYKLFYLLFLPVIWVATRHGFIGAIVGIAGLQIGLIVALVNAEFQSNTAVTEFQFMMLALAIAGMFLGMVVTESRLARTALDRSESRLRATVATASDSIITVSPDGRIAAANPATERIFSCNARSIVGLDISILLPGFTAIATDSEVHGAEGQRSDGSRFPAEVSVGSTGDAGANLRIAVIRDITRRVESNRRLAEQQEELGRASRLTAAGEMAAALAHELHQPLTAIRSYARASQMQTPDASAITGKIEREATRAAAVVQRLRDFFRSGTSSLETMPVGTLVQGALEPMRELAAQHGIRIETAIDDASTVLLIDRIQVETVVHSLVHNAMEAMNGMRDGRRRIHLATRRQNDGWVCVSITDSGPGIAATMSERVFEPFATTKATGTGMGLAMSRSMIEAHGGRIWYSSSADGTVFHFTLPSTALNEGSA